MGTKKFITLILFSLVVLSAVSMTLVSAKYITLSHAVTMEKIVRGDKTTVNISLTNSGDEAAHDVQLSLLLPRGVASEPIFLGKVNPNMPQTGTFDIRINPDVAPGKYLMVVLTEYKDANGYPFSSVSPNSLILKEVTSPQVSGRIPALTLGDKETKKLTLDLRNMDQKDHNLQIKLFAPRELKIEPGEKSLTLNGRGEEKIEFSISSFGALPGSSYVVFAAMEYDEGGIHYSSTASGVITVVEQKEFTGFQGWLPLAALGGLIVVFVYFQFKKR